jgi:hypothetical protein
MRTPGHITMPYASNLMYISLLGFLFANPRLTKTIYSHASLTNLKFALRVTIHSLRLTCILLYTSLVSLKQTPNVTPTYHLPT